MKENIKNPLLDTYQTPFNTPPFDQIENHHYIPAFDEGIKLLNEEILHIANNKEDATERAYRKRYIRKDITLCKR